MITRCTCGAVLPTIGGVGRLRDYCSNACRQRAYRTRHALPVELTSRARWVRHVAKRPVTVTSEPASSTNAETWATYADAKMSPVGDGLGFALGDGVACIDIDHCLENGHISDRAVDLLARFPGAYVEVSPSGTGLHVWGLAPEQMGRHQHGYEVYSRGRYMTVTGRVFRQGGLVDISAAF